MSINENASASHRTGGGSGRQRTDERGVVLIWAAITVMLVAGVIFSATDNMRAIDKVSEAEFSADGLASEAAQAGLTDAFAWYRRQPVQPVEEFLPALDLAAATPVNETDNPAVGLVRTAEITPGIWARYTVRKGFPSEEFTDNNGNGLYDASEPFVDVNGDQRWTPSMWTHDVTSKRGLAGRGIVWKLVATGEVYKRPRTDMPLGAGPNIRLATKTFATEIRRLALAPPGSAAICVSRGDQVWFNNRSRTRSEEGTVAVYPQGTGSPNTSGGEMDGGMSGLPNFAWDVKDVFGVSWTQMRSMADMSTRDGVQGLPKVIPDYNLVVVQGDAVFTPTHPLRGTGILVVEGNCTIQPGSNSFFSGVIYCTGTFTASAPTYLRGTVMANRAVLGGSAGDYCEIEHDPSMVATLSARMGNYRIAKSTWEVAPRLADGRPSELHISRRRLGNGYAALLGGTQNGSIVSSVGVSIDPTLPTVPTTPTTPTTPDPTPTTPTFFAPDPLLNAVESYIAANPSANLGDLIQARDKLQLAQQRLAQDPPNVSGAVNAVKQAMNELLQAMADDVPLDPFSNHIDAGDGTQSLFPQIGNMVDNLIQTSQAGSTEIAEATNRYNQALGKMTRARDRLAAGNDEGALQDYRAAANKFKQSLQELDL